MYSLDGHDFTLRNYCKTIPQFAQNFQEAPRFAQLDVAIAVHAMVKEEVTRKHANVGPMANTVAPGPDVDCGKKEVKALFD